MIRLYWWLRIIWYSARWIFQCNLGDRVAYRGKIWILSQGVCAPTWTLRCDDESAQVSECNFYKIRSLSNYLHSFRTGYRFYMGNWYKIWLNQGITPWMRACNIWPRGYRRKQEDK